MKKCKRLYGLNSLGLLPLLVLFLALYAPARGSEEPFVSPEAAPAGLTVSAPAPEARSHPTAVPAPLPAEAPAAFVPAPAETASPDKSVLLRILDGGEVLELDLHDYLTGVVAAEMPASFTPEALEAQAVAARTDTLYRMLIARPHRDADGCTDPGCCKAYLAPSELRSFWGADYDRWLEKVEAAVTATDGQILTYGGEPIFAAFHAASAGETECSENVWIAALPYLRAVSTPETEAEVPGFTAEVRFAPEELREYLSRVEGASLGEDPETWLTGAEYSDAGRLLSVTVGGREVSGTAFRALLGLRSTSLTWSFGAEGFTFVTRGYGHGVGLSQYGAEVMARAGAGSGEILLHYYAGAALGSLEDVFFG